MLAWGFTICKSSITVASPWLTLYTPATIQEVRIIYKYNKRVVSRKILCTTLCIRKWVFFCWKFQGTLSYHLERQNPQEQKELKLTKKLLFRFDAYNPYWKYLPILFTVLRCKTSKPLPIPVSTHLEGEGFLTFCKCRKHREIGLWKPLLVPKFAEKGP